MLDMLYVGYVVVGMETVPLFSVKGLFNCKSDSRLESQRSVCNGSKPSQ